MGTTLAELRELLGQWGIEGRVVGKTPNLCGLINGVWTTKERSEEIRQWLQDQEVSRANVESFVILDDDDDVGYKGRHIKTDMQDGLTEVHAEAAIGLLQSDVLSDARP
jgi:hypothetical protein